MNANRNESHKRWKALKDKSDSVVNHPKAKPCPICGRKPIFYTIASRRSLHWQAVDYCGILHPDSHKNQSMSVHFWNETVHYMKFNIEKSEVQGYWKRAKYRKAMERWKKEYDSLTFFAKLIGKINGTLPKPPVYPEHESLFKEECDYYRLLDKAD